MSKREKLLHIVQDIHRCDKCTLKDMPHVTYRGNIHAPIMVLGEAPGLKEHEEGKPWVGPAGKQLDECFSSIGLDTNKHCFITNAVKARPVSTKPGKQNDTPKIDVIRTCSSLWLKQEIKLLKPKIIVCMGKTAATAIAAIDSKTPMSKANGMELWYDESMDSKVLITYHTASIIYAGTNTTAALERKGKIINVLRRAKTLAFN